MPVPVPRLSKPPSHPVIKNKQRDIQPAGTLPSSLPPCPTDPPPSFGTREEWINSLPAWRRDNSRRVWEEDSRFVDHTSERGFQRGLTAAGNAPVIKGAHAEACIPPLYTLLKVPIFDQFAPSGCGLSDEGDNDDMGSDYSMDHSHLDNQSQWTASSPPQEIEDIDIANFEEQQSSHSFGMSGHDHPTYERGAFSPICEDRSPDDPTSSPLEPVTPFGVFVDRAVASGQVYPPCDDTCPVPVTVQTCGPDKARGIVTQSFAPFALDTFGDVPKEPVPAAETATSSVNTGYKRLSEPLANWVADYVWKVCTTGLSLPSHFVAHPYAPLQYAASPPSYLAVSIHSLLLSTLLQPSAVFLAIWYMIRLPVHFGPVVLDAGYGKEAAFRAALLGDPLWGSDKCGMEASAPFRLVVLGCMLANKWLDDHTFSNKTWHSISNVPIHVLNKLEALALDAFSYDLSVPSREWSQWLTHLLSYHKSLSSPGHPQPISRPSSSPHGIIRKAIEEIMEASANMSLSSQYPQPVFIGLEERRREKLEKEMQAGEVLEIDLDEDGPLREEYMPKRRVSASLRDSRSTEAPAVLPNDENIRDRRNNEVAKQLPPPAKWSPAGDEPILRERNHVTGHYVAVQPPHLVPFSMVYHQPHDIGYNPGWNPAAYLCMKPQHGYIFDFPHVPQASQNPYNYSYVPSIPLPHSRSQSLSYSHDNQMHNHSRSYSQAIFEYRCSDIRMTVNEPAHVEPETHRLNEYAYSVAPPFGAIPALQTAWLRT